MRVVSILLLLLLGCLVHPTFADVSVERSCTQLVALVKNECNRCSGPGTVEMAIDGDELTTICQGVSCSECDASLTSCQSDLSSTQTSLDTCTTDYGTTTALLSDCSDQLGSANASLSSCEEDLLTLQTTYGTTVDSLNECTTDLGTATDSLSTCQSDLSSTETSLSTCTTNYGTATTQLSDCTTQVGTLNSTLTTCQQDLADASGPLTECTDNLAQCETDSNTRYDSTFLFRFYVVCQLQIDRMNDMPLTTTQCDFYAFLFDNVNLPGYNHNSIQDACTGQTTCDWLLDIIRDVDTEYMSIGLVPGYYDIAEDGFCTEECDPNGAYLSDASTFCCKAHFAMSHEVILYDSYDWYV